MGMNKIVAAALLEEVLGALAEVGNGATHGMLKEAAAKLGRFRDEWFSAQP